jgi:hypothetical protein
MKVKKAAHQFDDRGGFRIACRRFQGADRSMHDLVDDAAGQRFDGHFLIGGHRTQASADAINLGLANGFEMVLQADDGRNHVERLQAGVEFIDLAIDDRLRFFGFLLAIGNVRTDRLLQIVDVIDEDAVDLVHLRIDVAGHGDIDEEHGLVLAQRHELFAVLGLEDEVRRAGRGNDDVGAIAGVVEPAELDRLSVEFLRQPGWRGRRSDWRQTETRRRAPADAGRPVRSSCPHPPGRRSCRSGCRRFSPPVRPPPKQSTPTKIRRRFRYGRAWPRQSPGEQLVELRPHRSHRAGRGIGFLDLAKNLGLADDHGVQAGGHAKNMTDGFIFAKFVEMTFKLA